MSSTEGFEHLDVLGMDINLHLLTTGPRSGIPVIFLHGIPVTADPLHPCPS